MPDTKLLNLDRTKMAGLALALHPTKRETLVATGDLGVRGHFKRYTVADYGANSVLYIVAADILKPDGLIGNLAPFLKIWTDSTVAGDGSGSNVLDRRGAATYGACPYEWFKRELCGAGPLPIRLDSFGAATDIDIHIGCQGLYGSQEADLFFFLDDTNVSD